MVADAKFDEYINHVLTHGRIRGDHAITQIVAVGAAESGLDNMAVGRNDLNGSPITSPAHWALGLGWLQHDTYWLERETAVNGVQWTVTQIRQDPKFSLELLFLRPGMILYQGTNMTYIDYSKWAVWPSKSDAFVPQAEAALIRAKYS